MTNVKCCTVGIRIKCIFEASLRNVPFRELRNEKIFAQIKWREKLTKNFAIWVIIFSNYRIHKLFISVSSLRARLTRKKDCSLYRLSLDNFKIFSSNTCFSLFGHKNQLFFTSRWNPFPSKYLTLFCSFTSFSWSRNIIYFEVGAIFPSQNRPRVTFLVHFLC